MPKHLLVAALAPNCRLSQAAAASRDALSGAIAERLANAPAEALGFDSREISMPEEDREL